MDYQERNKLVSISRWQKRHELERQNFKITKKALILKSVLCGFLAGDGSVQLRLEKKRNFYHYQIDFFPDDDLMRDFYINAMKYIYNKSPSVRIRDNVYHVRISSKSIYYDLITVGKFGVYTWRPSYKLFNINGSKEAWLSAFFSAEAYVGSNHIKIQTVNKQGILEVSKLLSELCIDHSYYEYIPKQKNNFPVSIIHIRSKSARYKFLEKIGFYHNKKTIALKKSLDL